MARLDPPGRHRTSGLHIDSRHAALRSVQALSVVVSLVVLLGFYYGWSNYRHLESGLNKLKLTGLGKDATNSGGKDDASTVPTVQGKAMNILIVGLDSREDLTEAEVKQLHVGDASSLSTDSMMIVHVPANGSKATLISLPRDSWVNIPGHPAAKLNAAFADGYYYTNGATTPDQRQAAGADELIATVKELTGAEIDHFVEVGFEGFYDISKVIGPITVNLCAATYDHNSGFRGVKGENTIYGASALAFVRQRDGLPGGDLAREKRQQYFLSAAFRKIATAGILLNPSKLDDLIGAVKKSLYVDSGFSILDLAEQMDKLSSNDIKGYTIPNEGDFTIDDQSAIKVDPATVRAAVTAWLNPSTSSPSSSSASSSVSSASSSPPVSASSSSGSSKSCIY